jgi:hypothetical protein
VIDQRSTDDMAEPRPEARLSAILISQQLIDRLTDGLLRQLLPVLRKQSVPFDSVSKLSAEDEEEAGRRLFLSCHQALDQR